MATQKEISIHLDLSERRVRSLIKDGILPASKGPGGNSLDICRFAYIRYLRGVFSGQIKEEPKGAEPEDYKNLIDEEKYREIKRENDIADDLVAPVSLLTEAISKAAAQVIPIMDALPLEMKRRNPRLTGHDIMLVKKSVAKCRNAIAETKVVLDDN